MGNCSIYKQIQLIPRVLINVNDISTETTFFGVKVALPIYITACALGRLGHKEGELCLTRAAGTRNIIQMIPTFVFSDNLF